MSGHAGEAEKLLTPAEVAALFRVDPKTVTRWAKAGKLNSIRTLGGHRRYRAAEVYALLDQVPGGAAPSAPTQRQPGAAPAATRPTAAPAPQQRQRPSSQARPQPVRPPGAASAAQASRHSQPPRTISLP